MPEPTVPDLRSAARAAIRDVERYVTTCPGCGVSKADGVHRNGCSWAAFRAALAAEATEPPPDPTLSACIAVIRRYRDGWDDVPERQSWVRHIGYVTGDPPEREVEPMSDTERAVIEEIDRG